MNSLKNSCINYDGKTLHEIFHKNTALSKENIGVFSHYISIAMESGNVKMIKDYKNFSNYERIDISNYCNRDIDEVKLVDVLLNRRSCRSFNGDSIPFNDFATILKYSCCASYKKDEFCFFTYPISGGIDSLYFIIIVNNVEGLDSGIYIFNSIDCELILLSQGFEYTEYEKITASFSLSENSCFSIHIMANTEIKCFKYQDRGYRFLNLEAGHVAQSLCLVAEGVEVGSVASGGFLDLDFLDFLKSRNIKDSFFDNGILLYEIFFGKYDF
ncbi:SagB/ThcOx family dehydrogenase [Parvimonas micra]|uniref:SagB/ThcOx family dehydrogenase n=1 Tax=Parvimonas micra TaxID=33033 RepID=UPI002B47323F|nr:SagB/ThcOx family dehydrogenase [Parvimonas micra]MEB3060387.1 SagB/ThcOx family dehydrogenase [Parvimonas micra]MEB3066244.1 SagB/ThcOx family dehydrogenase [Parvimonas micra]